MVENGLLQIGHKLGLIGSRLAGPALVFRHEGREIGKALFAQACGILLQKDDFELEGGAHFKAHGIGAFNLLAQHVARQKALIVACIFGDDRRRIRLKTIGAQRRKIERQRFRQVGTAAEEIIGIVPIGQGVGKARIARPGQKLVTAQAAFAEARGIVEQADMQNVDAFLFKALGQLFQIGHEALRGLAG